MLITRLKIFSGNILTVYIIFEHQFFYIETIVLLKNIRLKSQTGGTVSLLLFQLMYHNK